ncbi:MAG: protein-glutamate O-methyltransferase CheR, partial [Spirochaetales bacterium]|nr:protein-glutamate O-methyltransferase CheR [Spirochaetales bacterium]
YVIPHVIENKRKTGETIIKVWSAGCSTGEEPYTIAMILKEILPPPYTFQITASDLSLKCLMTAQQGFYADSRVDGIPADYLNKYFTKVDGGYQVNSDLMKSIKFDYHNLKNDSGQKNLDVVFCRNVLIYFDEPAQLKVINHFWDSMAPNSYLYIGHSESLFGMDTKFEFLKTDWACLYQKHN